MEYYDLYDKERKNVIKTIKSTEEFPNDLYREIVHVLFFHNDKLLIQKRHPAKSIFPNLYNLGVSGNVLSQESVNAAARREVKEELGLEINMDNKRVAFTINFDKGFDDFFLIKRAIDISELTLQKSEVTAIKWASKAEIKRLIQNKQFVPYTEALIDLVFFMKDEHKIHVNN